MKRGVSAALAVIVSTTTCGVSGVAVAQEKTDKNACANAYEQAQRQRQAQALKSARKDLLVCSRPECPSWVRRDCVPWLAEVDAAMPSIVVSAKTPDGASRTNARVIVDGVTIMDRIAPDPIALDPGEHVLVVVAPGAARVEQRFALKEGERGRHVDVTLTPLPNEPDPSVHTVEPPPPNRDETSERPTPPLVYVLGTAGIVVAGVGTYLTISGMSARNDLYDCAPRCDSDAVADAKTKVWAGNVVIGVGVVALAAAVVLYFARPAASAR